MAAGKDSTAASSGLAPTAQPPDPGRGAAGSACEWPRSPGPVRAFAVIAVGEVTLDHARAQSHCAENRRN